MTTKSPTVLSGLSDIRSWFWRDPTPIWYACASPYTLLGMDEWVRGFRMISHADCFDGAHPRVFVPKREHAHVFPYETLEEMNAVMLSRPEVQAHIRRYGPGKVALQLFDETSERLCRELDLELVFPSAALRRQVDDKVEATRLADRAGVASVPCVLGQVTSWEQFEALSAHLGVDRVIQTPFGDSGTTTFFVSTPADLDACLSVVSREREVKVMRKIRCAQAAVEACVTDHGTIVGPVMTEIVGFSELTPYKGGWAGNEIAHAAFTTEQRDAASERTRLFGDVLKTIGYMGYFEIDWLVDLDDGELYLGEVNPRVTGASPLTNLAAFAHADAPLFLFHLLQYSGSRFELDIDELNRRWAHPIHSDPWGQLILKHLDKEPMVVVNAPRSGVWRMHPSGSVDYEHFQAHRRTIDDEGDAFFLRTAAPGDEVHYGDDLGVVVVRGRLMNEERGLTARARAWNRAIREQFTMRPL